MKLFYINLAFVLTPAALGLLGFLYHPLWLFAALLPIGTGILQFAVSVTLFIAQPKNLFLHTYFLLVVVFFSLWKYTNWEWIWAMPPTLAIYMSVIIYLNSKPQPINNQIK